MTYEEAKPYLKEGMIVNVIKSDVTFCRGKATVEKSGVRFGEYHQFLSYNCELEILTNPDGTLWIHPDKQSKFKVGDRVRINKQHPASIRWGKTGIIRDLTSNGKAYPMKIELDDKSDWTGGNENCIEKIEDTPKTVMPGELGKLYGTSIQENFFAKAFYPLPSFKFNPIFPINEVKPQKKTTLMNSIINKIKDLKLSADDRILRKHGFEDENGMTSEAMDLMDDELQQERWAKRRSEIAEDLRKVEESEKK